MELVSEKKKTVKKNTYKQVIKLLCWAAKIIESVWVAEQFPLWQQVSMQNAIELNAIQRSNPEMQKRVMNAIRAMAESR